MIGGIEPFSLSYWPANHWVFSGLEGSNDDTHTHTHWRMESAGTHTLRDRCRNSKRPNQPASYQCFQHLLPPSLYDTHTHARTNTYTQQQKNRWRQQEIETIGHFCDVYCCSHNLLPFVLTSRSDTPTHTNTHFWQRLPYLRTPRSLAQFEQYQ